MDKYIDYKMCQQCKGVCCQQNGCVYLPSDFKSMSFKYLNKKLKEGKISISGQVSSIDGLGWTYMPYLRARNKSAGVVDLITNGGPCINLTENGCCLSEECRPTFGLLVKPTQIGGPCKQMNSQLAEEWFNYSIVLEKLIHFYTDKNMIDLIVEDISKQLMQIKDKKNNDIELSSMEKLNVYWYYQIMANRPYYTPEEVKRMILK